MNARIFPIVLAATLVTVSTGCSGVRNFLFGRGARCGLCSRLSTAGQALNPLAPGPSAGSCQGPGTCGVTPYAPSYQPFDGNGYSGPMAGNGAGCESCVGSGYANADCGCRDGVVSGYGGFVDPYGGGVMMEDGVIVQDDFYPRGVTELPLPNQNSPTADPRP